MSRVTIHLIANAHLDPVWLWDLREGLNEGISTCRTILDLMDEDNDLTFIRGEAAIYHHIEEFDPETFERIQARVQEKRWDIVGGTWIQPDTNLPSTASLLRQFERGQEYFQSRFGIAPKIAWAADSFGHSAGLPAIMAASGMTGFAFTRPGPAQLELPSPAFWWEGPDGSRILSYRPSYGWYGCERSEMEARLDITVRTAQEHGLEHVACFYGLGNHGGGPTRRLLRDLQAWRVSHAEIDLIHSGLHRFFAELKKCDAQNSWPVFRSELGLCLRGCYSSALSVKKPFRDAEAALLRAETLATVAGVEYPALAQAADSLLLNAFHDILPGTSIERALDEQRDELAHVLYQCRQAEMYVVNNLAARIDTTVPAAKDDHPTSVPFLVVNPHSYEWKGYVQLECCLDSRPIFKYEGNTAALPLEVRGPGGELIAFQRIATECDFMRHLPWRARVVIPATLPALGWGVYTLGYVPDALIEQSVEKMDSNTLANTHWQIQAITGHDGIKMWHDGKSLFGESGLTLETLRDEWGSWGGISEEPDSLLPGEMLHQWQIEETQLLESGQHRQVLWTRYSNKVTGGNSWMDFTFTLYADAENIEVSTRLRWNERASRLKMVLPVAGKVEELRADFEVPGAVVTRGESGEVPGGHWVRMYDDGVGFCFASDALSSFELRDGALRVTIARATRYASDAPMPADVEPWRPTLDSGELKFRFLIAPFHAPIEKLARELDITPIVQSVPPSSGEWPRSESLGRLSPSHLKILSLRLEGGRYHLRVQNTANENATPTLELQGRQHRFPELKPSEIGVWDFH